MNIMKQRLGQKRNCRQPGGHGAGVALWLVLLLLTGIAWPVPATAAIWPFSLLSSPPPPPEPVIEINETADLRREMGRVADELFTNLADPDPENGDLVGGVVVVSFVDQKNLHRTSSFGRYLAEQLMNELQRRQVAVLELRKSNSILIQEKRGEYGLSRNHAEIREEVAAAAMMTGTYTVTPRHIVVNARIIDNRSARLLSSATAVIPRNEVANALLAERATAVSGGPPPEPIYMKRLEL